MSKKSDDLKKWIDDSSQKINDAANKVADKFKSEVKYYQNQSELNDAYENASYLYEIIGTTNLLNKPKRIRGFLVEDDLKILFRLEDLNNEFIVKNVVLKDIEDLSLIQIDKVFRDEIVYLDLKVDNDVVPIGCFYATYKAKDIPKHDKNVVKVEEDEVVGTVHFHADDK